ncbi:unnamed protein product [Ceutorhynchus assimilis]|uniref:Uncharacterized protein n=1 Tax=Ceutorhynchus assimilis TaxID=467358 RepID=A0A9N9N1W7_9CUCU|nr:unnamed protein product [Ceutorhynchus assimilis]
MSFLMKTYREEIMYKALIKRDIRLQMDIVVEVVLFCCCIKIRVPRTKQEIEADYKRKKIATKFRKRLKIISNQDMEQVDLRKALEIIIEADYKQETPIYDVPANDNDPLVPVAPKETFGQKVANVMLIGKWRTSSKNKDILHTYIVWSNHSEIEIVANGFYQRGNIPGVVGAINVANINFKVYALLTKCLPMYQWTGQVQFMIVGYLQRFNQEQWKKKGCCSVLIAKKGSFPGNKSFMAKSKTEITRFFYLQLTSKCMNHDIESIKSKDPIDDSSDDPELDPSLKKVNQKLEFAKRNTLDEDEDTQDEENKSEYEGIEEDVSRVMSDLIHEEDADNIDDEVTEAI